MYLFFFFNDTATTEIYTLSLHDALPISYVIRHKVLVEKLSVRRVARELGVSRNRVRRYVEGARPGVRATVERTSLVKERVWSRLEQLLAEAPHWTGGNQRLTAARLHQLLLA